MMFAIDIACSSDTVHWQCLFLAVVHCLFIDYEDCAFLGCFVYVDSVFLKHGLPKEVMVIWRWYDAEEDRKSFGLFQEDAEA